jgi:hypothetical protein
MYIGYKALYYIPMEITQESTYEECVAAINEAADDLAGEYPDVSPDEFWTDLATSMLTEASEKVAREVCRVQIGWVPLDLEMLWRARKRA